MTIYAVPTFVITINPCIIVVHHWIILSWVQNLPVEPNQFLLGLIFVTDQAGPSKNKILPVIPVKMQ